VEDVLATKHHDFVIPVEIDAADNTLVYGKGLLCFYFFHHYLFGVWWQVIDFSFSGKPGRSWAQQNRQPLKLSDEVCL